MSANLSVSNLKDAVQKHQQQVWRIILEKFGARSYRQQVGQPCQLAWIFPTYRRGSPSLQIVRNSKRAFDFPIGWAKRPPSPTCAHEKHVSSVKERMMPANVNNCAPTGMFLNPQRFNTIEQLKLLTLLPWLSWGRSSFSCIPLHHRPPKWGHTKYRSSTSRSRRTFDRLLYTSQAGFSCHIWWNKTNQNITAMILLRKIISIYITHLHRPRAQIHERTGFKMKNASG